jgi:hypothetical protein
MADPYNEAVDHFDRLGCLLAQPKALAHEVLSIIGLCQVAIHRKPQHKRAQIMLADIYCMASKLTDDPQGKEYFLVFAICLMTEWRLAPAVRPVGNRDALRFLRNRVPTHGRKVEDEMAGKVIGMILDAMIDHFFAGQVPDSLPEYTEVTQELGERLHARFINQALDPGEIPTMAHILGVAED